VLKSDLERLLELVLDEETEAAGLTRALVAETLISAAERRPMEITDEPRLHAAGPA
jgi:hypothetical protein